MRSVLSCVIVILGGTAISVAIPLVQALVRGPEYEITGTLLARAPACEAALFAYDDAGWPFHSFASGSVSRCELNKLRDRVLLTARSGLLLRLPGLEAPRFVSLKINWVPFLLNALIFFGPLECLRLLHTLRRAHRHRHARCLHCAYPIGESDCCSECGSPLP